MTKQRVAILGGGPSGLSTAFALSDPSLSERFEVTVYQLGWRAGGHCSSGRVAPNWWVDQNGTHFMFGCYAEAIGLLRSAFDELEQRGDQRFGTFEEQLIARSTLVMKQMWAGEWTDWVIHFPEFKPHATNGDKVEDLFHLLLERILQFVHGGDLERLIGGAEQTPAARLSRGAGVKAISLLARRAARLADHARQRGVLDSIALTLLAWLLRALRASLSLLLAPLSVLSLDALRAFIMLDLGLTCVIGLLEDDAIGEDMVSKLDGKDFRDWLRGHGASESTVNSPPVKIWYQAIAAFEHGNGARPSSAAGASMCCLLQIFFRYEQALSFQLRNEVGDSVVGPIVAALEHRGVKFAYFHRLWDLEPDETHVARVVLEQQAELKSHDPYSYQPFFAPVNDRPVWPEHPLEDQIERIYVNQAYPHLDATDRNLENFWCPRSGPERVLTRGKDYDVLVLAVTGTVLKWYTKKLASARESWRNLGKHLQGVETQGLRLWLLPTLANTGWPHGPGILSGYTLPFATWEDPTPVLASEVWPPERTPHCVASFFGPLEFPGHWPDPEDLSAGQAYLRRQKARSDADGCWWLNTQMAPLFPLVTQPDNPDGLDDAKCARKPEIRANAGPVQAYLHLAPNTWQYRMHQGDTGFEDFFVVGDWTRTSFPCGSIEGAVNSGFTAASLIVQRYAG